MNYGVPTGNQNQLDVFGTGSPIISATWATNTTPIDKQIQSLHQTAVQLTGYELKHAFYGKNVPGYLTSNTNLGNYFFRDSYGPGAFGPTYVATADIPNPLLGLTWHKAYQSFFYDQNGNRQTLVGDDQVVFTPEPSTAWIGFLEGTYPVPTRAGIVTPADPAVVSGMETRAGHVRLWHGQCGSAFGEDRLWGHLPAGAEGSQRDFRGQRQPLTGVHFP